MSAGSRLADAYARYAGLVVAQLEALEAGDLDALEPLARRRAELAGEIERTAAEAPDAARSDVAARVQLERCHTADVRLRARLGTLRADALAAVRRIGRDTAAARSYVNSALPGARLDVEL